MPDNDKAGQGSGKLSKRGFWRERDLQRAIGVAKRSRLNRYRVEIAPDGTIAIVVGFEEPKGGRRHS